MTMPNRYGWFLIATWFTNKRPCELLLRSSAFIFCLSHSDSLANCSHLIVSSAARWRRFVVDPTDFVVDLIRSVPWIKKSRLPFWSGPGRESAHKFCTKRGPYTIRSLMIDNES
jgi:hypothetical protein